MSVVVNDEYSEASVCPTPPTPSTRSTRMSQSTMGDAEEPSFFIDDQPTSHKDTNNASTKFHETSIDDVSRPEQRQSLTTLPQLELPGMPVPSPPAKPQTSRQRQAIAAVAADWRALSKLHPDLRLHSYSHSITQTTSLSLPSRNSFGHRSDRRVVFTAVRNNWRALKFASHMLRQDKELVTLAVMGSWMAMKYIHKSLLKSDRELVITGVMQNWEALQYVHRKFRKDREVMFHAASTADGQLSITKYAHSSLREDFDFLVRVAKVNPKTLTVAPKELTRDKRRMLDVVYSNVDAFEYLERDLRGDKEVAMAAVRSPSPPCLFLCRWCLI